MNKKEFNLQFLHHGEVFESRDAAMKYLVDNYKPYSLDAEPVLVKYGTTEEQNVILAFGTVDANPNGAFYAIDFTELQEKYDELKVLVDEETGRTSENNQVISEVIKAVGLEKVELKDKVAVNYKPNQKDEIIGDATDVTQAINLLSEYVRKNIKGFTLGTENTKSVKLTYSVDEDNHASLKAKVLVSTVGEDDDEGFNNNIIGVKSDGIYAAAHLAYDEKNHSLVFTTSGMKDGKFKNDAVKQVVKLDGHAHIDVNNEDHSVKLSVGEKNVLSADVKINNDIENNILKKSSDGSLYVEGKAKNIKYKNTTVAEELAKVGNNITELNKKIGDFKEIEISGDESDTLNITTKKDKDGDYTVSGDVRLSSNKSIIVLDGGLSVNMDINVDAAQNKLVLRIGNTTKEVVLPGVAIFDEAKYDPATKVIVIKFKDGSKINIPVGDLFPADSYGLKHNDTSVGAKLDELDAKNAKIIQDLIGEINERTAQAEVIIAKIEQETKDREHADEDIKHLLDDLKDELDITEIKEELKKFEEGYAEFEKEWAAYKPQIEKAIADAEAVSGRVTKLEQDLAVTNTNLTNLTDRVSTAEGNINNNASKIADNTLAITNEATLARQNENDIKTSLEKEITRSTAKDEELASSIASNNADIETAKTNITSLQNDLTAEVERAKGVENTINETLNSVKSTAEQNKTDITTNLQKLNDEITRATSKETEIEGKLNDEVNRAKGEENRIETLVNTNKDAIAENKNSIGVISTSIVGLRNELENEVTRAQGEEKRIDEKIKDLTDTSFAAVNNAIEQSKNYTDTEILKAKSTSADDATAKANQALADAKSYSDEKLALEVERAKSAEQTNADAITELKAKDAEIEANVAKKVENVRVEKNSQSDLQYTLYVDDKPAGEINIPKDQFLKDVRYDVGTKSLVFTWELPEHPETSVDISDFLTTYVAGNGLQLTENIFSVKLTTANESYLQVTTDGVQLVGIDAKFDTKADKSDVYTKLEVDNAVEAEAIRAKSVENGLQNSIDTTNGNVTELTGRVADAEGKLNIIQGNSAQEGSIEYALAKAKEYAEGLAAGEQGRAELVEKNLKDYTDTEIGKLKESVDKNTESITKLNGNFAEEGSVENAIYKSKNYTDERIGEISTEISKKANSEDVYTKTEIDLKGYLTNSDIENLATKIELQTETERAKAAEEQNKTTIENVKQTVDENTLDITQLKKDVTSLEPNVAETNSVKMMVNKVANGTTFSSDVKLDLEKSNILKISGNGLYAEVSLSYDTAENKLVFVAGGVEKDIQLAGASILEDAYYNSATRQIVFVVKTQSGETKQVTVDVNDLINTLRIENPANSPVQLTLTQDAQGNDLLSANLIVSTKEDNAILADNGTLFASKRAANMTALWDNDLDTNLQVIINTLKTRTDGIEELKSDVNGLKSDMTEAKTNIGNIQGQMATLETKLNDLDSKVSTYDDAIETLQKDVKSLKDLIGDMKSDKTIEERLAFLEDFIENKLLDFGGY